MSIHLRSSNVIVFLGWIGSKRHTDANALVAGSCLPSRKIHGGEGFDAGDGLLVKDDEGDEKLTKVTRIFKSPE